MRGMGFTAAAPLAITPSWLPIGSPPASFTRSGCSSFTRHSRQKPGATGDIACDYYHRYKEDIATQAGLGLTASRISLSWPRIIPDGRGKVNPKGIDFYKRVTALQQLGRDKSGSSGVADERSQSRWRARSTGGYAARLGHSISQQRAEIVGKP